jgi:hypothetical protein
MTDSVDHEPDALEDYTNFVRLFVSFIIILSVITKTTLLVNTLYFIIPFLVLWVIGLLLKINKFGEDQQFIDRHRSLHEKRLPNSFLTLLAFVECVFLSAVGWYGFAIMWVIVSFGMPLAYRHLNKKIEVFDSEEN